MTIRAWRSREGVTQVGGSTALTTAEVVKTAGLCAGPETSYLLSGLRGHPKRPRLLGKGGGVAGALQEWAWGDCAVGRYGQEWGVIQPSGLP